MKKTIASLMIMALLTGCAGNDPLDRYKGYNKAMFKFNRSLDHLFLRPLAKGYVYITPQILRQMISNFLSNISEPGYFVNHLLQGNVTAAAQNLWRFSLNSTFGLAGTFDVASRTGFKRGKTDFGITLVTWGMKKQDFIMLPVLGPSSFDQVIALPVDKYYLNIEQHIKPPTNEIITTARILDTRAKLLPADAMMKNALSPYVFMRNAYMQRRQHQIQQALKQSTHD